MRKGAAHTANENFALPLPGVLAGHIEAGPSYAIEPSGHQLYCLNIGETGRRLGDRFREHLRDVEINDKDASKPVARHFKLPNNSQKHMAVCGLSLHLANTEGRKNIEQKFIFQIGTLSPCGINERFSFL